MLVIGIFLLIVISYAFLRPYRTFDDPAADGDSGPPVPVTPLAPEDDAAIIELDPRTGREFQRVQTSAPQVSFLAPGWQAIPNRTDSFPTLAEQVLGAGGETCIQVDFHFDADSGPDAFGPLVISNPAGRAFAEALLHEYRQIYNENKWEWSPLRAVDLGRTGELGVLDNARRKGFGAVVSEFLNIKDPKNGTRPIEWARTAPGQQRLARALIAARERCGDRYGPAIGTIGHHGQRGTGGANFQGYHEKDLAEQVFAAITYVTEHPEPDPPTPVPGEKTLPDAYDKAWNDEQNSPTKPAPVSKSAPKKAPPKKSAARSGSAYSRSGSKPACKT
jgi:GNAT superfamily N-acetyltransferase